MSENRRGIFLTHTVERLVTDWKRVDAFLRFCPPGLPPFNDLIEIQEDQLFSTINHNPQHLLHYLLPPPSVTSQSYDLRHRAHNRSLPDCAGHLLDSNFILRIIFKDIYWM